MPLRDDLLKPIPGENPSGQNLKYETVYTQIRDARTEEDDTLPSGVWERTAKRADFRLVLKLAGETLATRSKDLQIAAWLGEAHLKQDGAVLLPPLLKLLLDLQEQFWDTIYPEIDEGDVGFRAVPLNWAGTRYAALVYAFALTKSGVTFHAYKASRAMGYEADAAGNDAKTAARAAGLKHGHLPPEEVDVAIKATPKSFYVELDDALRESSTSLEELSVFCEERYGDDGPSFGKLRDALEQVQNLVSSLLAEKRRIEPDVVEPAERVEEAFAEASAPAAPTAAPAPAPVMAAPTPAPAPAAVPAAVAPSAPVSLGGQPNSWEQAVTMIQACATYMSTLRRGSAVPYLVQTSIRWGELRKSGPRPTPDLLAAPTLEQKTRLQNSAKAEQWADVLEQGMRLVAEPCGRAWLDLHWQLWKATRELGYAAFAGMVERSVQGLRVDFPDMLDWQLEDGSQAASAEAAEWIRAGAAGGAEAEAQPARAATASAVAPQVVAAAPAVVPVKLAPLAEEQSAERAASVATGDVSAEAAALAASGQLRAAILLLARDAERQPTGRMRYRRRLEMAQLCVGGGTPTVAAPVLRELIKEIEDRKLESWESGDMVARPLALMLQCMNGGGETPDRADLFAKLCRIDPTLALEIVP